MNNHYNKKLKSFARDNRKSGTKAEIKIWSELLRARKMMGYSFLRQRPIDNYIADFLCKELKLIIEVDGLSHHFEEVAEKDAEREARLKELGFFVLRFSDDEVMNDIVNVGRAIAGWIENWKER